MGVLIDDYTELANLDPAQKHFLFYKGDNSSDLKEVDGKTTVPEYK